MTDLLNSGKQIDGVWTSGVDYVVVSAYQHAHKKFVPVVGADNNEFVHQLATMKGQGLVGAAVTNPPPVGAAGAVRRAQAPRGQERSRRSTAQAGRVGNNTAAGMTQLKAHHLPLRALVRRGLEPPVSPTTPSRAVRLQQ